MTVGAEHSGPIQIVHWLIEHSYAEPRGMSEDLEITTLVVDKGLQHGPGRRAGVPRQLPLLRVGADEAEH
jgi:hypothetical protein